MKNLIRAEFFKLKKSTGYKVLLITYLIMEILIQINNVDNSVAYPKYNHSYTGVDWLVNRHQPSLYCDCYWCANAQKSPFMPQGLEWLLNKHYTVTSYMVSIFLFIAFYVKGDFTAQTFYRGLLCGIPRKNTFWAKIIVLFAGIIPMMLISFLTGTVLWSIHSGFGIAFGRKAVFLIAKAFVEHLLLTLILVSHALFVAVITKSQIGTFGWSISTMYVIPQAGIVLRFLLSLLYLNLGTVLVTVLLELFGAGYIFEKYDLK